MVSLMHVQAKSDLHRKNLLSGNGVNEYTFQTGYNGQPLTVHVLANPVFTRTLTSFSQPSVLPFGVDTASANNSDSMTGHPDYSEIVNTLNIFHKGFLFKA